MPRNPEPRSRQPAMASCQVAGDPAGVRGRGGGYGPCMDELPPDPDDEQGEIRTEVGQSLLLVGMTAVIIGLGLLISLAF